MGIAMTLTLAAWSATMLQGGQEATTPDLLQLAAAESGPDLIDAVRRHVDEAREGFDSLLRLGVEAGSSEERASRMIQAERLAGAYLEAWADSFLVHRLERYSRWSADERAEMLEADSIRAAGVEAFYRQGPETAIQLWQISLGHYQALADPVGQAAALGNLGAGYYSLGELERALRYYGRSEELAEAVSDFRAQGNALGNIASVHKDRGELARAVELYRQAGEIRRLSGDRRGEAADLNNLGLIFQELGDLKSAESHFRQALALNRTDGRTRPAGANLTNLANLATIRGEYEPALQFYRQALHLRRISGDRRGEALCLQNIGLLQMRWGDYVAARRSLNGALEIFRELGLEVSSAELLGDIAAAEAAMGHLDEALDYLDRAEASGADDEYLGPALSLQRADLLTELSEYEAAGELYRRSQRAYGRLEDIAGQAEALEGLAFLRQVRGDYDAAVEAYARALLLQRTRTDPRPAALTGMLLGDAQLLAGDTAEARSSYTRALAVHRALGDVVAEARVLGALADLCRNQGALDTAALTYRTAFNRLGDRDVHPVRWYLHLGLGLTLRDQGDLEGAAEELDSAITHVEAVARTLTVEADRHGYLEPMWDTYAELALTEVAQGKASAAFRTSERMRARQLAEMLARGRIEPQGQSAELLEREQTLRRRIARLAQAFDTPPEGGALREHREIGPGLTALRGTLAQSRQEYRQLLRRLERSAPQYADLVEPRSVTVEEVQRTLPEDAVMVEYLVEENGVVAFVVSKQGIAVHDLPVGRKTLRQLIEFVRGTIGSGVEARTGPDVWRTPLRRLYTYLLEPLERAGELDGHRLLIIAPHRELHYLPFEALIRTSPAGEAFLVETFDVAYVPSASVWLQLARREDSTPGAGLLALAPRPAALAGSVEEVRAISRNDSLASVLVGDQATESAFQAQAPGNRIIHLAGYGVLNPLNPLFSFIELRADQDGGTDGRLEVHEIFGLDLQADLVVLSACQTALARGYRRDIPPGDDWVGLVRAFLYAGADAVVASLWPVEDRATARLMTRFYEHLRAGQAPYSALADAKRAFIGEVGVAHPFYWAGFILTAGVE